MGSHAYAHVYFGFAWTDHEGYDLEGDEENPWHTYSEWEYENWQRQSELEEEFGVSLTRYGYDEEAVPVFFITESNVTGECGDPTPLQNIFNSSTHEWTQMIEEFVKALEKEVGITIPRATPDWYVVANYG